MSKHLYFTTFILSLLLWSCSKSNEEALISSSQGSNSNSCTTENMKFNTDIAPIMQAHCNSCHSISTASPGVNTQNYDGVKRLADNGMLVGTITHASGFAPMPQGRPKLAACDINKIKAWIAQGARNN